MAKPFAMPELAARVRALIRRSLAQTGPKIVHGPLDPRHRGATRLPRPGSRFETRGAGVGRAGVLLGKVEKIVSKESIIQAVAGWDEDLSPNAIEVYISRLRTKLERAGVHILQPWRASATCWRSIKIRLDGRRKPPRAAAAPAASAGRR